MPCAFYNPSMTYDNQLSGQSIPRQIHGCTLLKGNVDNQIIVQNALLPHNIGGSILSEECPIASSGSNQWQMCPLYKP